MTPEQEDAHWALLGKPLMRHWMARRRLMWMASECSRLASVAATLEERGALIAQANSLRDEARVLWKAAAPTAKYTTLGHIVDGVTYYWREGGEIHRDT